MDNRILDTDFTTQELNLVRASQGKRLGNFFIDRFALKLVSSIFSFSGTSFLFGGDLYSNSYLFGLIGFYFVINFLYYFLFENNYKGKTLGKILTKTRVVNLDGSKPTSETIAIRTICRWVPFEALSFLGNNRPMGWHDAWSKTMVIDEELSTFVEEDSF